MLRLGGGNKLWSDAEGGRMKEEDEEEKSPPANAELTWTGLRFTTTTTQKAQDAYLDRAAVPCCDCCWTRRKTMFV
jgi:hypothetical protein